MEQVTNEVNDCLSGHKVKNLVKLCKEKCKIMETTSYIIKKLKKEEKLIYDNLKLTYKTKSYYTLIKSIVSQFEIWIWRS